MNFERTLFDQLTYPDSHKGRKVMPTQTQVQKYGAPFNIFWLFQLPQLLKCHGNINSTCYCFLLEIIKSQQLKEDIKWINNCLACSNIYLTLKMTVTLKFLGVQNKNVFIITLKKVDFALHWCSDSHLMWSRLMLS